MTTLEPRVDMLERDISLMVNSILQLSKEMKEFKATSESIQRNLSKEMKEFKATSESIQRNSSKEMKEFKKDFQAKWGALANKMGTIIEDFVSPNIPTIAKKYFHIEVLDHLMVRTRKKSPDNKTVKEFDVIGVAPKLILLNETKSSPSLEYINKFADSVAKNELFDYFPEYKGRVIIPIFASLAIQTELVAYLPKKQILALALKGDTMDFLNPDVLVNYQL